jgi:hypothetical protein
LLYRKQLSEEDTSRIANCPLAGNPLFLRALLEELRVFGVREQLDARIHHYLQATSITDLYQRILARYEQDYDQDRAGLVCDSLSLIWASRRGLTEPELMALLGRVGQPLPHAWWSPFHLAAEASLLDRRGLIGFSHAYFREAVRNRYVPSKEHEVQAHRRLVDYFEDCGITLRGIEELPWQLKSVEDWGRLEALLTDVQFMRALHGTSPHEYGTYGLSLLSRTGRQPEEVYANFVESPESFAVDTLMIVHTMLLLAGSLDVAALLSSSIVMAAKESGVQEDIAKSLLLQIRSMKAKGDYDYHDLASAAEQVCRQVGDQVGLAQSYAHHADFYKYHCQDLRAGIKWHEKEEAVLRGIGDIGRLGIC